MRSELLKNLLNAYSQNNQEKFIEIATQIVNEEDNKKHSYYANELRKIVASFNPNNIPTSSISQRFRTNIPIPRDTEKGFPLLELRHYNYNLNDIILDEENLKKIKIIIQEFEKREILKSHGLKPKQKILFLGPPGTGKTLCSRIISSVLGYPLVFIKFDAIISSYLGETASNLRKIFNFIDNGEWVILFDEFDIIGKKRDDPYEHGEIKRVVNNFMQMLDDYRGNGIIIAATNHPHLLDTAIWRRFDDIVVFNIPNIKRREELFKKYLSVFRKSEDLNIANFSRLTKGFTPDDISKVCEETYKESIINESIKINNDNIILSIENQKRKKQIIKNL